LTAYTEETHENEANHAAINYRSAFLLFLLWSEPRGKQQTNNFQPLVIIIEVEFSDSVETWTANLFASIEPSYCIAAVFSRPRGVCGWRFIYCTISINSNRPVTFDRGIRNLDFVLQSGRAWHLFFFINRSQIQGKPSHMPNLFSSCRHT
jgi:hypothetical protein